MARPLSSVLICAQPRTGSWLLSHLLWRSGSVGYPGEWFWRNEIARNREAWDVSSWADYLDRVLEAGTSANGVFAVKLMQGCLRELLAQLRRLGCEYEADDLTVLRSFLPDPRFVWIRRVDSVAQAVSWAKARQTGQWTAQQAATAEPRFDFAQIDGLYRAARGRDKAWQDWFAAHGIEPVRVIYEELCADPTRVTLEVLALLELEPVPGACLEPPPELTRQADETNEDWATRYRELARLQG
jgi:trehalose 2-sulfotransferase